MTLDVLIVLALTAASAAQPAAEAPSIRNGSVLPRQTSGSLARTIADLSGPAAEPVWIGWSVPSASRDDASGWYGGCRLEPGSDRGAMPAGGQVAYLEPSRRLAVFVRVSGGQVDRIRGFSMACPVDAGGRTVYWLAGTGPVESARWLADRASGGAERRLADGALAALAMHAAPEALDALLAAARTGGTPRLRGQALFWLAQRAGQQAVGAIADAIARDPDTEVKKRAVFALSQLPADEGVPKLIEVARAHSNPVVRKQAFFWLGQSKDPRALAFFKEVLAR
ncbi:MAG: HEAT repeat domain-containing protein [Vicinamibacterales bacterium]